RMQPPLSGPRPLPGGGAPGSRSRYARAAICWFFFALPVAPASGQQIDFSKTEVQVLPVQGNIYLLAGAGGNITVQGGKEGVLLVDTEYGPLVPKLMAEIRK